MTIPLQITASELELSESIEETIRDKTQKLAFFYDRILRCRVRIEAPHRHHHKGILFDVHIDLAVPGSELVVNKVSHEDLSAAIRLAFDRAIRRLEDYTGRRRLHGKHSSEDPLLEGLSNIEK
jgi:ribosome-associated translation inhibitor RaiA